jgi:hypothetical protein
MKQAQGDKLDKRSQWQVFTPHQYGQYTAYWGEGQILKG